MTPNSSIVKAIEQLNYRATVADVAALTGLQLDTARQGIIELADLTRGHLQVTQNGEIIYVFSHNLRDALRERLWQIAFREWLQKIWRIIFYLIRISFGIVLIFFILLMFAALFILAIATLFKDSDSAGGDFDFSGLFHVDFFNVFAFDYYDYNYSNNQRGRNKPKLNFLEAIFSFLFGDGNPNRDLEMIRWQSIAGTIDNYGGAIIGEQITPYLDLITNSELESEDYILPVLVRFNGIPEVSDRGEIIYHFPDLQIGSSDRSQQQIPEYLQEKFWQFTKASTGQVVLAISLGGLNLILALILNSYVVAGAAAKAGGFVAFIASISWIFAIYGIAFLSIPLLRYFSLHKKNRNIAIRNRDRQKRSNFLQENLQKLKHKLNFARQFSRYELLQEENIIYSTDTDFLDNEIKRRES